MRCCCYTTCSLKTHWMQHLWKVANGLKFIFKRWKSHTFGEHKLIKIHSRDLVGLNMNDTIIGDLLTHF